MKQYLTILIFPLLVLFALPGSCQTGYPKAAVDAAGDSIIISTVAQAKQYQLWHMQLKRCEQEGELLLYENTMASAYIADLEVMNGNLKKRVSTQDAIIDNLRLQNAGLSDDVKYHKKRARRNVFKWGLSGLGAGLLGGIVTGIIVSR